MLIVAITIGINSLLGIPWFVAATVLSINHVISLKKESESAAPGEKPKFLGVIEQRITGLLVFILIGSSVFLANLLRVCYFLFFFSNRFIMLNNSLTKTENTYACFIRHILVHGHLISKRHTVHAPFDTNIHAREAPARLHILEACSNF